jgi:acetate kinase
MIIIAVNAGSSSLKFQLLDMPEEVVIASGIVERIGQTQSTYSLKFMQDKFNIEMQIADHEQAVKVILDSLIEHKVLKSIDEIVGCGHRMVHGGEYFKDSCIINDSVANTFESLTNLAPLHNPANLTGYRCFNKVLPGIVQVGVFDTAFHQTMEEEIYLYPIPYSYYQKYGIRRYGFHGTSHKYVSQYAQKLLSLRDDSRIISLHLGNGASISAIKGGKSINTSMGLTPLGGIMMGTRCGDIDPSVVDFIGEHELIDFDQVNKILNKESGMLGVSGISSDLRDIQKAAAAGDHRSQLALKMFAHRVADYIGSYYIQLGGCDCIIFTAGIGENDFVMRKMIIDLCSEAMNISFDSQANECRGCEKIISTPDSRVTVVVIPTNEELMIARDVMRLIHNVEQ